MRRPRPHQSGVEELLDRFRCYLLVERGVRDKVAGGYVALVRPFVDQVGADRLVLGQLSAGEGSAFLVAESRRVTAKTAQRTAAAVGAVLRVVDLEGGGLS